MMLTLASETAAWADAYRVMAAWPGSSAAAAIFFVALEMGSLARFAMGRMRVRGSLGRYSTRARKGRSAILRNVTAVARGGQTLRVRRGALSGRVRVARRCAASAAFGSLVTSIAGNCHMREKRTPSWAPGSFISRVRLRGSRRMAAAILMWMGARLRRRAGISFVRFFA